jgi:hypothetical protein
VRANCSTVQRSAVKFNLVSIFVFWYCSRNTTGVRMVMVLYILRYEQGIRVQEMKGILKASKQVAVTLLHTYVGFRG